MGRSGDPRKRAASASPSGRGRRARILAVALLFGVGLVVAALVALRTPDAQRDDKARGHARAACDLTAKAAQAARVDTSARYAAATLLLDQAMVRSARAAADADEFADLDRTVRAVHAAAHRGRAEPLRDGFDTALASCRGADVA